jgi:hypothetical protein
MRNNSLCRPYIRGILSFWKLWKVIRGSYFWASSMMAWLSYVFTNLWNNIYKWMIMSMVDWDLSLKIYWKCITPLIREIYIPRTILFCNFLDRVNIFSTIGEPMGQFCVLSCHSWFIWNEFMIFLVKARHPIVLGCDHTLHK